MKLNESNARCSIGRAIDKIGDPWSLLILRDLGQGFTHFDEFERNLGIAPGVLSKRLSTLIRQGVIKKELYQDNPPRAKYVLTQAGEDFLPILAVIMTWGNKYSSPNGIDTMLADRQTHRRLSPIVVDAKTREPIEFAKIEFAGGSTASPKRISTLKSRSLPLLPVG